MGKDKEKMQNMINDYIKMCKQNLKNRPEDDFLRHWLEGKIDAYTVALRVIETHMD